MRARVQRAATSRDLLGSDLRNATCKVAPLWVLRARVTRVVTNAATVLRRQNKNGTLAGAVLLLLGISLSQLTLAVPRWRLGAGWMGIWSRNWQ